MSEIRVEIDLPHPPERVWQGLTDPELVPAWFLPTDLEPLSGGVFRATPHRVPGFTGPFEIEVVGVQPARSLAMQWRGDHMHAQVNWEIQTAPGGSRLIVSQSGFLGVDGAQRRRELRRAYQEMFEERLPAQLDRLAALDDPADPWAHSDPLVSAGVALPLAEPLPLPAETHARPTALRRLAAAFPLEERVRAAAITITVALIVVTVGWLWLTRPTHPQAPPAQSPPVSPAVGEQPGVILPSDVAPSASTPVVVPNAPGGSNGPVVGSSGGSAPSGPANPPPVEAAGAPLTATYATESSTGIVGYKVKVTLTIHNPGGQAHQGWTVVLTVPSAASIEGSSPTVDVKKDGGKVTITPNDGNRTLAPGGDMVFDVTFGGAALLGIGSGGVSACTIDGAACTHAS